MQSRPALEGVELVFRDRIDAGRRLAARLAACRTKRPVVYAVPRGGVVVAHEIAKALDAELDLVMVQKIGHPSAPEYAIGAVADDGDYIQEPNEIGVISKNWFLQARLVGAQEARKRRKLYLANRRPISAEGRVAIIVDDGLSTGLTMALAVHEVRHHSPARIIVAVPVAPRDVTARLLQMADEVLVLHMPRTEVGSLSPFYKEFGPISDKQVIALIQDVYATAS